MSQPAVSRSHAHPHEGAEYARRQSETTLLYRTLQAHWLQFLADLEAEGGELPAFVKDEFEAYFRCGVLAHGFLCVRCKECGFTRAVGLSCKRRGFCPSCIGRRMADTAAFCVDHLFPKVPVRQFVLSVPVSLRFILVDVLECPKCRGRMKILAAMIAPTNVRRVLEGLGLPSEAPRLRPARPPPQTELGDPRAQSDEFYADPPSPEE